MKKLNEIKYLTLFIATMLSTSAHAIAPFSPDTQPITTGALPAVSSPFVGSGVEKQYYGWHETLNWRGHLEAYALDKSGTVAGAVLWDSGIQLNAQTPASRKIVTMQGAAKIEFATASLSAAQLGFLGTTATERTDVVDYLRGVRTKEKTTVNPAGIFRERTSVLGDIVHSSPVFVGEPKGGELTSDYTAFKLANANRARRIYVGANDGMLHAFDAGSYNTTTGTFDNGTGNEVFAYIPSMLMPKLKNYTSLTYAHNYYVDGGINTSDAKLTSDNSWHTVLVGALGAGGRGLYALDVTDPTAATPATAANKILWEITNTSINGVASTDYEDLGDTYSSPVIAKMNNGVWAAIVGNGYNSIKTGKAYLYVINLTTGARIAKLKVDKTTNAGSVTAPNGLSSPATYDTDGNGTVDTIYAGDVNGNLWKFDVSSSNPGDWDTSTAISELVVTNTQPITGAPTIKPHPLGGVMVNFATGGYFTAANVSDATVQNYAFGVWDGAPAANAAFLDQTMSRVAYTIAATATTATISANVLENSAKPVNYTDASSPVIKPLHKGWKTALPAGASVVADGAFIVSDRYTFVASNPSAADPDTGNWLVELDYLSGGARNKPFFDLNSDGILTDQDRANIPAPIPPATTSVLTGASVPVGIFINQGVASQPVYTSPIGQFDKIVYSVYVPGTLPLPPSPGVVGLPGGHFDTEVYDKLAVQTSQHIHQYSDVYDATGINFLNAAITAYDMKDPAANASTNRVPPYDAAAPGNKFFIIVANGDLSTLATVRINDDRFPAPTYPNTYHKLYRLADLSAFSVEVPRDVFLRFGLHPTVPGCVKGAGAQIMLPGFATPQWVGGTPGKLKEWRNGALTIQVVKGDAPDSAIRQNVSGRPEKGYVVTDDQYLLHEYNIYRHTGNCYDQTNWDPTPPAEPTSLRGNAPAPKADATDPGHGDVPTLLNTSTVTTALSSGGKSVVSTSVYSDLNTYETTIIYDVAGKVVSINTIKTDSNFCTGPSCAGGDPKVPVCVSNPALCKKQDTLRGSLGRVGWHELFNNK